MWTCIGVYICEYVFRIQLNAVNWAIVKTWFLLDYFVHYAYVLLCCCAQQLSSQLHEEKSLLEEELHKINEDIRRKQEEVEGMFTVIQSHALFMSVCLSLIFYFCKLLSILCKGHDVNMRSEISELWSD